MKKIMKSTTTLKKGTYIYNENAGYRYRIDKEYDYHHGWYECTEILLDEEGNEMEGESRVLTKHDVIGSYEY